MRFISIWVLIGLSVSYASPPEENSSVCDVPVCDVPAKIQELEGATYQGWNDFFKILTEKYGDTSDVKILENLYQFSAQAVPLIERLVKEGKQEGWVKDAPVSLRKKSIMGLIKNSPFDVAKLVQLYKDLGKNESAHNDVIKFLRDQKVPLVKSIQTLREYNQFFQSAKDYSATQGEEEWLLGEIQKVMKIATQEILRLDPFLEGIYELQGIESKTRAVILHTGTQAAGLRVRFFYETQTGRYPADTFSSAVEEDTAETVSGVNGSSSLSLQVNPTSGDIEGSMVNPMNSGDAKFTGKKLMSPAELFRSEVQARAVSLSEIPGEYDVSIDAIDHDRTLCKPRQDCPNQMQGTLRIKKIGSSDYFSSYQASPLVQLQFNKLAFTQTDRRGFFYLTGPAGADGFVKWVMGSVDPDQGVWEGIGFSDQTSGHYRIKLKKHSK